MFYNKSYQNQNKKFRKNRRNVPKNNCFGVSDNDVSQCKIFLFADGKQALNHLYQHGLPKEIDMDTVF